MAQPTSTESCITPSLMSKPSMDPNVLYEHPIGLGGDYNTFKLQQPGCGPIKPEERAVAWTTARKYLDEKKEYHLGFQTNLAMNFSKTKELTHWQDTILINVGDPFVNGNFNLHTKFFERPLLDYFAALWNAKWPSNGCDPESYWGYALSMGGTEGNLYAMWNGRDYLEGNVLLHESSCPVSKDPRIQKRIQRKYVRVKVETSDGKVDSEGNQRSTRNEKPICFFSKATHYSLKKAAQIVNITTFYDEGMAYYRDDCPLQPSEGGEWDGSWPSEVPANADGSVNITAMATLVRFFAEKRKYSILICFNYGTVYKGSYDDIEAAGKTLIPIFQEYGLFERRLKFRNSLGVEEEIVRNGWWFHVDGALGAAYMPFIEMARRCGREIPEDDVSRSYKFDFSLKIPVEDPAYAKGYMYPIIHSISVSGHKWTGVPIPCGIFMTKTEFRLMPPQKDPIYIGSPDTTFSGSRGGLAAAFLWDHFSRHSFDDLMEKAIKTQEVACYLVAQLKQLQEQKRCRNEEEDLYISRAKLSLAVVFKRPKPEILVNFSLSKEEEPVTEVGKVVSIRYLVHAYAMENVTYRLIDDLMDACSVDDAFTYDWSQDDGKSTRDMSSERG